MRYFSVRFYLLILFCTVSILGGCKSVDYSVLKTKAWEAWENGEIDHSGELAKKLTKSKSEASSGFHLLFLKEFLEGKYEEALLTYEKIDTEYPEYGELDKTVVNAYLHLRCYEEAEQFAVSRNMEERNIKHLKLLKEYPFKAELNTLAVIPFTKGPLGEYFPGFEAELNGEKIVANVDTGGAFLHMAPDRAEELGIELTFLGQGRAAGELKTDLLFGIAKSFRLGDVDFENVPVVAVAALKGQNFVIFGTNVLQRFFSTLDYPNDRLILSPRDDAQLQKEHLAMLPTDRVEIPFYMGGNHYMFARGALGDYTELNFFIDSGLVLIRRDEDGKPRQAAFTTDSGNYERWGYDSEEIESKWFKSHLPLSLGPLTQEEHYFTTSQKPFGPYEGVKIHGLLSHAFLKKYSWTIDFTMRKYIFSSHPKE